MVKARCDLDLGMYGLERHAEAVTLGKEDTQQISTKSDKSLGREDSEKFQKGGFRAPVGAIAGMAGLAAVGTPAIFWHMN